MFIAVVKGGCGISKYDVAKFKFCNKSDLYKIYNKFNKSNLQYR